MGIFVLLLLIIDAYCLIHGYAIWNPHSLDGTGAAYVGMIGIGALLTIFTGCFLLWWVVMAIKFWGVNRTAAAAGSDFRMEHGFVNYLAAPRDLGQHLRIALVSGTSRKDD